MMVMSVPYESTGRSAQKARTREALVEATRKLLAQGVTPTVESAATSAGISRTTAYRYFPNQRMLLLAAHPEIELQSLLPDSPPDDREARLRLVVDRIIRITLDWEPQLRTSLRLSLEAVHDSEQPLLRRGRAIGWIEEALLPLGQTQAAVDIHRLALAIRAAIGIEALVWLTDIGRLSRDEAADLMRWSAMALLRTALAEASAEQSQWLDV